MNTAEKIYQKALTLPETAQTAVLHVIELLAQKPAGKDDAPLSREEVVELRARLAAWEQDWNAPGMEAYDKP
jgi:hypothetical protein